MQPSVLYIGHGSLRFTAKNGSVVYVDPFFPGDYSVPADLILLTHNRPGGVDLSLVTQKEECLVVTPEDAVNEGGYNIFGFKGVVVNSYETLNDQKIRTLGAGYMILLGNGIKVYCAGDTVKTTDMEKQLSLLAIDYAFLPIDGETTMSPSEAAECAEVMEVTYAIPIHNDYSVLQTLEYSDKGVDEFDFDKKIVLKYGESLDLERFDPFSEF